MTEFRMPSPAEGIAEAVIARWLKKEGKAVNAGDDLVEIETDKVTMILPADASGILQIVEPEGASVAIGAVIARIVEAVAAVSPPKAAVASAEPKAPPKTATELEIAAAHAATREGKSSVLAGIRATPLARLIARKEGIDLATLAGTGPYGLVTRADVTGTREPPPAPAPTTTNGSAQILEAAGAEIQKLSRLQMVIARRMVEAKATIPDFQVQAEAAVDALLALRAQLKELGDISVPSVNDFVIKAAALALREHPRANASFQDDYFLLHESVNVGFAVAATDALIVPTVRDADKKPLLEIAAETRRLAERARAGTITTEELAGGTFTVSDLGMYGMTAITPIINAPQAAILGVAAARDVPNIAADGSVRPRSLMTLTLSCDHRVLYGADASEFLSRIRALLEQPLHLTLGAEGGARDRPGLGFGS